MGVETGSMSEEKRGTASAISQGDVRHLFSSTGMVPVIAFSLSA